MFIREFIIIFSTIALTRRTNSKIPCYPGGTTEMGIHNISGPETTHMEFPPVSVELMGIVLFLQSCATVTVLDNSSYPTKVNCFTAIGK
jgi:uncharacterized membrane protein